MTGPNRLRFAEKVADKALDDLLGSVAVEEEVNPYLAARTANPYAAARAANPYAAARTENPYAAAANPYAVAAAAKPAAKPAVDSPYAFNPYTDRGIRKGSVKGRKGRRKLNRTLIVLDPGSGPKKPPLGELLHVSAAEFEQCFDFYPDMRETLWCSGATVEFTDAAESMFENDGGYGDRPIENMMVHAFTVKDHADTLQPDQMTPWGERESPYWHEVMALSQVKRQILVDNPDVMYEYLSDWPGRSRRWVAQVAGMDEDDVTIARLKEAMEFSTTTGLGAAALDTMTWETNDLDWGLGGVLTENIHALLRQINEEENPWIAPLDQFLLHSDQLHPLTPLQEGFHNNKFVALHSTYIVTTVDYHHDTEGRIPYGWRICHLVPHGKLTLPDFAADTIEESAAKANDTTAELF